MCMHFRIDICDTNPAEIIPNNKESNFFFKPLKLKYCAETQLTFMHRVEIVSYFIKIIVHFMTHWLIYANKRSKKLHHISKIWQDNHCNRLMIDAVSGSFQHYLFPLTVFSYAGDVSSTIIYIVIAYARLHFVVREYPRRWALANSMSLNAEKSRTNHLGQTN